MKCVLTAEIAVTRLAVFAEMAWLVRRPELGLLCRAAQQSRNRITADVVQSALPGVPDAGASNVIAWCETLALCDRDGGLTSLGEDVAVKDEAPIPEQGVYGLWVAEHPLLGCRALSVERLASNKSQRFEKIERLRVLPDLGKVFVSVVDQNERFIVRDLPTKHGESGAIVGETRATCALEWQLDFDTDSNHWQLRGKIEGMGGRDSNALVPIQHEPESEQIDLWKLVAAWARGPLARHGRWLPEKRRLAVRFDGLSGEQVDSFRTKIELDRVEVPQKGSYEDVTLEDVPIGPQSAEAAQQWAMARFDRNWNESPRFRSRTVVRQDFASLTEETPLEEFGPTLPSHEELLARTAHDLDAFWSLAAPVDLAPYPVTPEELGTLDITATTTGAAPQSSGVVRIPYRGGWSMRRLTDRLLEGVVPVRVLLCDRYVRGDANLQALEVFVASLRSAAPKLALQVWTDDEDSDFKRLRSVTGSPPRGYRDAFDRNWPHDRYLLVQPAEGPGFGWQMSNSPLHARVDMANAGPETPLRWKDLIATRVTEDELHPALRQWLAGGHR